MQINPNLRGQKQRPQRPERFASDEGAIRGWCVRLPGGHPLATPAVVDGRIYLGGGFGSYDFYALEASSGDFIWHYQTEDDGPTAAVVAGDCIAFNTESCELEVLNRQGRRRWKKWLGDPLMSMPAAADGRIYMAYPDSRGDHRHYLACFDISTGTEYWKQPIGGEIITAPVLADGHVYLATLDGTLFSFKRTGGAPEWWRPKNATSSPTVWNGQCYFSQRHEVSLNQAGRGAARQTEHLARRGATPDAATMVFNETRAAADYLDHGKRARGSPAYRASMKADAAVGFAAMKGDAKMDQAMKNLGLGHVHGVWAYQGSKPFISKGRLYNCQGCTVRCVDPDTEAIIWQRTLYEKAAQHELLDSVLTPPSIVNGKIFLGSTFGDVFCLAAHSGDIIWKAHVDEPVIFQPAVAQGRVYLPTGSGSLYCLETGDPKDDGWLMWGATAAHNGLAE